MMTLSRSTRAHQIADHAVLVDRHLVGIEMLRPFGEPGLLAGGDIFLERSERALPPRAAFLAADLGDERIEHQAGIADEGEIDAILLVDVARVVGRMDDGLAGRHARARKRCCVRLEPIASTRSARFMNSANIFERERVEAPSASGWLSAMALLPGLVATTGAGTSSASAARRSPASA